jgi:plastocyanin
MKPDYYLVPVCCVVAMACYLSTSPSAAKVDAKSEGKPITVTMKSLSYDPKKLEIRAGDAVVWTNKAYAAHTATSDDDGKTFDSGSVEPGASSKAVKFEKEGEFKYHCVVHGKTMSGTIIVKAAEK